VAFEESSFFRQVVAAIVSNHPSNIYGLWHKFGCVFLSATAIWKFFTKIYSSKPTLTYPWRMAEVLPPNGGNANDFDPLESNDPSHIYAEYDKLRNSCPAAFTDKYNGYWLLSRYEDVKSVALDGTTYISSVKAVVPSDPRGLRRPPLNFDAPAHIPYRTALDRTLKPTRLKRLEQVLEAHAEKELAPMLEAAGGDICMEFGARFPAWVETEWLNLDSSYTEGLATSVAGWIKAWRAQDGGATTAFSTKLYKTAEMLLENRRQNPRCPEDDPASSLLLEKDAEGNFLENSQLV
jgi:cytochrome P450